MKGQNENPARCYPNAAPSRIDHYSVKTGIPIDKLRLQGKIKRIVRSMHCPRTLLFAGITLNPVRKQADFFTS